MTNRPINRMLEPHVLSRPCPPDWNGDARVSQLPIFLRPEWFRLFDRHIRLSNERTVSLSVVEDGRTVSYLPAYTNNGITGRVLNGVTNFYSPIFRIISLAPIGTSDYVSLARHHRRFFYRFDRLNFVPLLASDAKALQEAFEQIGLPCFVYIHSVN